ncbi:MAG: hypothetical protein ACE14M_01565 [Terriglobales bacterium]
MRTSISAAVVVLLAIACAVAQTNSGETGTNAQTQLTSGNGPGIARVLGDTIEGCLTQSAENYFITDISGKTYQVIGTSDELTQHVGQRVRITGDLTTGAGENMANRQGSQAPANATGMGTASSAEPLGSMTAAATQSGGTGAAQAIASTASSMGTLDVSDIQRVSQSCPNAGNR